MGYNYYDLSKQIAFGIGVGIGVGIIVSKLNREKSRQREQLIAAISQLANEVKLLREVLLEKGKAVIVHERNPLAYPTREIEEGEGDEDDEYFEVPPTRVTSMESIDRDSQQLSAVELKDVINKVETLRDGSDEDKYEAYNVLLSATQKQYSDNVELIWRLGRAQYEIAMLKGKEGNQEAKLEFMKKGIQTAKYSLELDDKNSVAHKWYAILVGSYSEFENTTEKIKLGYEYKKHIDRAIELNPTDPSLYGLLGRWCYEVYMLPWYVRKATATLYAEPPTATLQDALKSCLKAEELNPGFWKENMLFIGKCYYQNSEYDKAKEWLLKARDLKVETEDDRKAQKDIEELLLKL